MAPKDKRPITLADDDEEMELFGVESAQLPSSAPAAPSLPALPQGAWRFNRPLTLAERTRLETALKNQQDSTRILDAVRALLQEKGVV